MVYTTDLKSVASAYEFKSRRGHQNKYIELYYFRCMIVKELKVQYSVKDADLTVNQVSNDWLGALPRWTTTI